MPPKCVVPGCTSNYASNKEGYITVFKFPRDEHLKQKWVKSIPRKDCDVYTVKDNNLKTVPRISPILKDNVEPTIFPGLPKYLSSQKNSVRRNPDIRKDFIVKRQEDQQEEWLESDLILNFSSLYENFQSKLSMHLKKWKWQQETGCIYFYLVVFDHDDPDIRCSIKILESMKVEVRINHNLLVKDDLSWILPLSLQISRWSQIENILARYSEDHSESLSLNATLNNFNSIVQILKNKLMQNDENEKVEQIDFLAEQFNILFSNHNRFSVYLILKSFLLYVHSKKVYSIVRENKLLTLPHPKYLTKLCGSLKIAPDSTSENKHYIKTISEGLSDLEKYIVLQIDEIYIKETLDYKNGNLVDFAENDILSQAKTVQAFLISSVFGSMKEVDSLQPVRNISGDQLHEMVTVVAVVSDNVRVNQNMLMKLTEGSADKHYFHLSPDYPTFVMY
ncbi:unnamed protein product [Callosobruchus maculatus]|uniref:THAP-type domain-containing protein n=1 Tax=Callosobruchus maculatus TaxID=64391 RepID=A0A653CIZ6_CALMS|nr:unnamed protein product [Callosobruchus maculatus]